MSPKVASIPRRPIRIAFHVPVTKIEHEALWELGRIPVSARLYAGAEPKELSARALGRITDAQLAGDRVVITSEWVGEAAPPDRVMDVIGYVEQPLRRPASAYPGIGSKLVRR